MRKFFVAIAGAMLLAVAVPRADAAVIYNNLGAGDVPGFGGAALNGNFEYATRFTPGATYTLDQLGFYVTNDGPDRFLQATLFSDAAGAPGAALETLSAVLNTGFVGILTFDSLAHPNLVAGTTYWASLTAPGAGLVTVGQYARNGQGLVGGTISRSYLGPWGDGPQVSETLSLRVQGTPVDVSVPEPTLSLLLVPAAVLLRRRMRR